VVKWKISLSFKEIINIAGAGNATGREQWKGMDYAPSPLGEG
jgi:hypothetical protein